MRRPGTEGFTLVEVLLTLVILLILLGVAYSALFTGLLSWRSGAGKADLQQNARLAVALIASQVREAGSVANVTTQKGGLQYTLDEHNLFLHLTDGSYVWYYQDGDKLRSAVRKPPQVLYGGHNEIAYNIQELTFEYNALPLEESRVVGITVVAADRDGRSYRLHTKARLRVKP